MKIKRTKQMRLDELIKYIFDNGIEDKAFISNGGSAFDMCEVRISGSGNIITSGYINEHTTFTVKAEERLDITTKLSKLTEVFYDNEDKEFYVQEHEDESIEYILDQNNATFSTLAIFYGKTHIWSAEHGIPTGGVLEVES